LPVGRLLSVWEIFFVDFLEAMQRAEKLVLIFVCISLGCGNKKVKIRDISLKSRLHITFVSLVALRVPILIFIDLAFESSIPKRAGCRKF
jgi:hypothetical protein